MTETSVEAMEGSLGRYVGEDRDILVFQNGTVVADDRWLADRIDLLGFTEGPVHESSGTVPPSCLGWSGDKPVWTDTATSAPEASTTWVVSRAMMVRLRVRPRRLGAQLLLTMDDVSNSLGISKHRVRGLMAQSLALRVPRGWMTIGAGEAREHVRFPATGTDGLDHVRAWVKRVQAAQAKAAQ